VDAAGNSWCCEYDERGNLLAVTDPLQQNTRYWKSAADGRMPGKRMHRRLSASVTTDWGGC
ncbi:TPA: hypothetical protein J1Z77_005004, partial [Escherichia coli]|nr:hypothetical protein [Escherichia coli]HBA7894843.1 hypothetical protein [Escherichia coli]